VTEQLLDDVAAEDLGDIDSFVPGLQREQSPAHASRASSCAASSTDDFGIGTDPAVGVYVDRAFYAGRGGGVLLPFTDVQRIEVLKGPQGTLFGRNTAAGAISIITTVRHRRNHAARQAAPGQRQQDLLRGHGERRG
jgi:iron complex outermembrane receptor protein